MSLPETLAGILWVGVTCYALFGGADFGAGIWDLTAGSAERGRRPRAFMEHAIGPVWEANHVWLIFVLVIMWTAFPPLFGAVASTLYIPLTAAALGVIGRGAAFAFRKQVETVSQQRLFGAVFAASSVLTPFFLGAAAGAVASGRVPPGVGAGNSVTSWANPTAMFAGVLAVTVCAYLAAVYLTADARRAGDTLLVDYFRRRAIIAAAVSGALTAAGLVVARSNSPHLYHELTHAGLALAIVSAAAGTAAIVLIYRQNFVAARISAGIAVTAVLWSWGVAQYPHLLTPGLTINNAASTHDVLAATTIALAAGALLVVPSLIWLYRIFQQPPIETPE